MPISKRGVVTLKKLDALNREAFGVHNSFDDIRYTLKMLWKVAEAAEDHMCSARDGYPDPDDRLNEALAALEEGGKE